MPDRIEFVPGAGSRKRWLMLRRYVLVVLVMLPAVRLGAAEAPDRTGPIVEGTRTHTARGGGRWRSWFNAKDARVVCANKSFLWLAKSANLWRYNVADRRIDMNLSPLTHPELDWWPHIQMDADGRTAIGCPGAILFYDGRAWSRLPQPSGNPNKHFVVFDSDRRLWASVHTRAYRWEGKMKRWSLAVTIPQHSGLWRIGDKWFLWNNYGHGQGKKWKAYSVEDAGFTALAVYPAGTAKLRFTQRAYQTKAGLIGVFWRRSKPFYTAPWRVCRITDTKIEELISAKFPVIDLASGKAMALELGMDGKAAKVSDAQGKEVASLPAPPFDLAKRNRAVLHRDGNGDYWLDRWRCDGKVWEEILPPGAFVFDGSMRDAVRTGRLRFDKSRGTWVDAWPHLPVKIVAYDPNTRTGWLAETGKLGGEPCVSRKYRFSADGSRELLQTLTRPSERRQWPTVQFEHGGDTWLGGVNRWDGDKFHHYDDGWEGKSSPKLGLPKILLSPKGGVWMYHTQRFWQRYNPKTSTFGRAEPFDEFQFTAEGGTYAIVGFSRCDWSDSSSHLGVVYKKSGGLWRLLSLVPDEPRRGKATFPSPLLKGVFGRAVRGGRMLVSCRYGVFEIDLKTQRWAYLSAQPNMVAWFDDAGRRVMASNDEYGQILTYQGDPFSRPDASGVLADALERSVAALLKRMDDDSWRVRSQATAEAINLIRKQPRAVADILRRAKLVKRLPLEVQDRITVVLEQIPAEDNLRAMPDKVRRAAILGNSLHERMHPPMTPNCEYTIRPGMDYEHVKAVLNAAGAVYGNDVHNHHSRDRSYQGYILPDNTMVYMRVTDPKAAGKVLSLGLGKAGKGYDRKWDWDDTKANGLKLLELKPPGNRDQRTQTSQPARR